MIDPKIYVPVVMMLFGAVVAATLISLPSANKRGWMIRGIIPALAHIGGLFAFLYSIWFFCSRLGWVVGLMWWAGLAIFFAFIARVSAPIFPSVLIVGMACMYIGFAVVFIL